MKGKQIDAILSDYDGTLCPTTSVRAGGSYDVGTIPTLDCKYMLDFNQLPLFLRDLMDNDFIFLDSLLPSRAD